MLLVRLKNELSYHLYLCQHYLQLTIDIVDIIIDRIMNELVLQFSIDLSLPKTLSSAMKNGCPYRKLDPTGV